MGNSASTLSLTPRTFLACFDEDGNFDEELYWLYRRRNRQHDLDELDCILDDCIYLAETEMREETECGKPRSRRAMKSRYMRTRNDAGDIVPLLPKDTVWYRLYVTTPDLDNPKFHQKFRRRFRLPHDSFCELVTWVREDDLFARWQSFDAVGKESSPLELLVLGALRYLGRGWTFDDLEESTSISEETHRQFMHVFIHWASTVLYERFVSCPMTAEDAVQQMLEYAAAGCHGCLASSDATHIGMEKCSFRLRNMHMGPKLTMPSRTYNMSVNHRRRILSTTTGHPSRWNDKTLQLYDELLKGVYDGSVLGDFTFVFALRYKIRIEKMKEKIVC
jgi:hypothetical protein